MKQQIPTMVWGKAFSHATRGNSARKVDWVPLHTFGVSVNCSGQPWTCNVIPGFVRTPCIHSFVPSSVPFPLFFLTMTYSGQFNMLWLLLYLKGLLYIFTFGLNIISNIENQNFLKLHCLRFFFFFPARHQHVTLVSIALGMGVGGLFRTIVISIIKYSGKG